MNFNENIPMTITWNIGELPPGEVVVGITEDGELCRVSFLRGRNTADLVGEWQQEWPATRFKLGKIPKNFKKLPMLCIGNELQRNVLLEVMQLTAGEVATYGEIAERIDMPGRARAVGRACKLCYISYLIPCHRVIGAQGIGGFGTDGTLFKEELLKAEGVTISAGKRRYF